MTKNTNIKHQQSAIAREFSQAANKYHHHNRIQRVAAKMLQQIGSQANSLTATVLDIGAGPGTDFPHAQKVIAVDIAMGMLTQLGKQYPHYHRLCADAQNLPLATTCIDHIYSNLALQWCGDLQQAALEIYRVLKPGAESCLSLISDGSLPELAQLGLRCNAFLKIEDINACFKSQNWGSLEVIEQPITLYFDNLRALLMSLKGVGASADQNATKPKIATGLKGRNFWAQLEHKAGSIRTEKGLPLTYRLVMIRAKK